MPKGFFLPKPKVVIPPPPTTLKVSFPAELWTAIEMAAKANEATPQAIVLHAVRRALRHELVTAKRGTTTDTPTAASPSAE